MDSKCRCKGSTMSTSDRLKFQTQTIPGTTLVYWEKGVRVYHRSVDYNRHLRLQFLSEVEKYALGITVDCANLNRLERGLDLEYADVTIECVEDILLELSSVQIVSLVKGDRLFFMFGHSKPEQSAYKVQVAWGAPRWLTLTDHIRVLKDRHGDWVVINRRHLVHRDETP